MSRIGICKNKGLQVLMVLLIVGMCGCGTDAQDRQGAESVKTVKVNPLQQVQTVEIGLGEVKKRDIYDGIISPYIEELCFSDDGIFLEYRVQLGEEVSKGDILAITDTEDYEEQAEQLQEQIDELTRKYTYEMQTRNNSQEICEMELEETLKLIELTEYMQNNYTELCVKAGNLTSQIDRLELEKKHLTENYDLELPYLQGQLTECKKKLRNNVIKAPFDGVVVGLQPVAGGDRISEDTTMVALADTTRYLAVGDYVSRRDAEKAERIYVFMNGLEYEAEYIPMDKKVYSALAAKDITPSSEYELYPEEPLEYGHAVRIVVQHESRQQVLVIPALAVQQEGSRKYCYRKGPEGREKVYLETGLSDGLRYEVLSGLREGDEVYID